MITSDPQNKIAEILDLSHPRNLHPLKIYMVVCIKECLQKVGIKFSFYFLNIVVDSCPCIQNFYFKILTCVYS